MPFQREIVRDWRRPGHQCWTTLQCRLQMFSVKIRLLSLFREREHFNYTINIIFILVSPKQRHSIVQMLSVPNFSTDLIQVVCCNISWTVVVQLEKFAVLIWQAYAVRILKTYKEKLYSRRERN